MTTEIREHKNSYVNESFRTISYEPTKILKQSAHRDRDKSDSSMSVRAISCMQNALLPEILLGSTPLPADVIQLVYSYSMENCIEHAFLGSFTPKAEPVHNDSSEVMFAAPDFQLFQTASKIIGIYKYPPSTPRGHFIVSYDKMKEDTGAFCLEIAQTFPVTTQPTFIPTPFGIVICYRGRQEIDIIDEISGALKAQITLPGSITTSCKLHITPAGFCYFLHNGYDLYGGRINLTDKTFEQAFCNRKTSPGQLFPLGENISVLWAEYPEYHCYNQQGDCFAGLENRAIYSKGNIYLIHDKKLKITDGNFSNIIDITLDREVDKIRTVFADDTIVCSAGYNYTNQSELLLFVHPGENKTRSQLIENAHSELLDPDNNCIWTLHENEDHDSLWKHTIHGSREEATLSHSHYPSAQKKLVATRRQGTQIVVQPKLDQ